MLVAARRSVASFRETAALTCWAVNFVEILADHGRLGHHTPIRERECRHGPLRILRDEFRAPVFTSHNIHNVQLDLIFADATFRHVGMDQVRVRNSLQADTRAPSDQCPSHTQQFKQYVEDGARSEHAL